MEELFGKNTISTKDGHLELLRMLFRLKNMPTTFQRVMDHTLNEKILDETKMCSQVIKEIYFQNSTGKIVHFPKESKSLDT